MYRDWERQRLIRDFCLGAAAPTIIQADQSLGHSLHAGRYPACQPTKQPTNQPTNQRTNKPAEVSAAYRRQRETKVEQMDSRSAVLRMDNTSFRLPPPRPPPSPHPPVTVRSLLSIHCSFCSFRRQGVPLPFCLTLLRSSALSLSLSCLCVAVSPSPPLSLC